ncbi:hypothetical protein B6U79_01740 [Candidatus Bathyarchaeota archaeon ex4484_231]|nr:MAG: hypothetical protein B6U79_01740 [Candidatus Bathyarchaeota archaeon ex4484_231]
MSVYVGKDVKITIQVPAEEDVTDQLADLYDFAGITSPSATHKASSQEAASEPGPSDGNWVEFDDTAYGNVAKTDDARHSETTNVNGNYPLMLFQFKSVIPEADAKKIVLTFEGYAVGNAGNGTTVKVWNHVTSAWENAQTGSGGSDEEVTVTLTSDLANYIDGDGYVYLLVRSTNPSDGNPMTLYCDYVKCFVTQAKFTVSNVPISDGDLDGVSNEAAHVTVKKGTVELTVSSVTDDTGEVVLADGDFAEDDRIVCEYRFDGEPYVAQEITVEPKRRIEGIDGLGSDTVQQWAVLLKEVSGSIKEVLKPGDEVQLRRFTRGKRRLVYSQPFYHNKAFDDDFEHNTHVEVRDGCLYTLDNETTGATLKDTVVPKRRDLILRCKIKHHTGDGGWRLRQKATPQLWCYSVIFNGSRTLSVSRVENDVYTNLISVPGALQQDVWTPVEVELVGGYVHVKVGDNDYYGVDDAPYLEPGDIVIRSFFGNQNSYDEFQVWEETGPAEYGMIVEFDRGGSKVRIGLDRVVFPEGSIPSPKNRPVFIVTPFRAQTVKTIS